MLASILIRLGGVVAMVGGAASATLGVLTALSLGLKYDLPGSIEKAIQKGGWEPRVANMLLIGALAAIIALHALQRQHYGSQGPLAALAAFIGLVMLPVAWLIAGPPFPIVVQDAALIVGLLGVLAASLGIVGLGIVTINAGVLPRWCGIALIVGSPPGVGILFLFMGGALAGILPGEAVWELAGIAWIVVGYAIFRAAGRRIEQHPRVR